jgi:hypothetical protein
MPPVGAPSTPALVLILPYRLCIAHHLGLGAAGLARDPFKQGCHF